MPDMVLKLFSAFNECLFQLACQVCRIMVSFRTFPVRLFYRNKMNCQTSFNFQVKLEVLILKSMNVLALFKVGRCC